MTRLVPTAKLRPDPWAAETAADWSDAELLQHLRARPLAALQELYTRYFPPAYALAVRMLDDPAVAEECVQAVFLAIGQHPPSVDPPHGDVGAWVLQAIHQQAQLWQRRPTTHHPLRAVDLTSPAAAPVSSTGPGRFAARRRLAEQQQATRTALATLPPVERRVLELAYFRGMTLAEIAAALPASLSTVKMHLRVGLDRLRAALAGGATPIVGEAASATALGQLAAALAGMEAAQQKATDLRHRAQDVQRRSDLAQQRAAAQQQRANTTLQQLAVLQELYTYLDTVLAESLPDEPTFVHTTEYFAQHPHAIAVSQVIAILTTLNAHSDREAHRLLPVLLHVD